MIWPPKGVKTEDSTDIVRQASETRPISMKNTDNKTITGASVEKFTPFAQNHTHPSQRGFVPARNYLENVVDLDSAARIYSMMCSDPSFKENLNPSALARSPHFYQF